MTIVKDQGYITRSIIRLLILIKGRIAGNRELVLLALSFILLLPAMFILPLISIQQYSIIRNTVTELGSHSAKYSLILNFIFVSLGVGTIIAGWRFYEGFIFQRIILLILGISLILTAFFNHDPVISEIRNKTAGAGWHAYFAGTTLLSFIILSTSTSFILEKQYDRFAALAAGISVIFLSLLMSGTDRFAGIWHRLIFIIIFGWQLYTFKISEP